MWKVKIYDYYNKELYPEFTKTMYFKSRKQAQFWFYNCDKITSWYSYTIYKVSKNDYNAFLERKNKTKLNEISCSKSAVVTLK